MNEKIKKLAQEAGFALWADESWNPGEIVDWSTSYDDELNKFAELIVKECANICYHTTTDDGEFHAMNLLYEFNIDGCKNWK